MSDDSDFSEHCDNRKLQKLEDKIEILERENSNLKQQFSQAVKMTETVKQQLQKNDELNRQVRQLQRENTDLHHRIEILKKAEEENSEKQNSDRQQLLQQREEESERAKQETERVKSILSQQVSQLQAQIEESERLNAAYECELKKAKDIQTRCLNSAAFYFQEEVESLPQLISLFENSQTQETQISNTPTKSPVAKRTTDVSEKKYRSTLKKLKVAKETIAHLEAELSEATRNAKEASAKQASTVREYEAKLRQTAEESQLKNNDQEHQITILTNKVENLKSNLQKSRTQMNQSQTVIQSPAIAQTPERKFVCSTPLREMNTTQNMSESITRKSMREEKNARDEEMDQMVAKNTDLTSKLQAAEARKDSLADQLLKAQQERKELEVNAEKQKHSLNVLSAVHKETIAELETVRNALTTISPVKDRADKEQQKKKKESARLRAKISVLENTIENQKAALTEANEEAATAKTEIAQLTIQANKLEEDLRHSDEQIKSLSNAVYSAEARYESKPTVTEQDLVPPSAWRYAGFDQELASQIIKISQNSSLQVASKLQAVFKTIKQYYDNIIASSDDDADRLEGDLAAFRSIVDKFIVDVSIASTGNPVTLDEFLENEGEDIVSNVSSLKHSFDDLTRRYNTAMALVQQYRNTFCDESEYDVSASIVNLKQSIDQRQAELEGRNKRVKELKNVLDKYQKKVIAEKKQLTEENENLKSEKEELISNNSTLTDEVSSLKRRNQELTNLVREAREENEQLETTMMENQDEAAQNAAAEMTRLDESLRSEIKEREEQINQREDELDEASEEIRKLKSVILSQRKAMDDFTTETNEEKEALTATIAENESKYKEEKEHIINTYEAALAEIKKQNEARREDIEKLSQDIEKCDQINKNTKKKLSQVKREKHNIEEDFRMAQEQFERQNKLSESQHLTEIMELEANYSTRSNEQIEQFEKDKLDIFTYAANEFKDLFKPSESINESTYRSLISKVHTEFNRLHKSDTSIRRITNAAEKQTTEDAVMQLLM